MTVSMIVAKGKNNEIGGNNDLLWYIPSDLKFFKATTMGKSIIMGRKTFQSLPKALPGRKNIVISSNKDFEAMGATVVTSLDAALKESETEEVFIIGGASIYEAFFPLAQKLYITEVDFESDKADVFFPEIDLSQWKSEALDEGEENGLKFKHILYIKS
ncbi:MAG: dihydrofolate reductase [Clostridia bacterium]|nr:dihydrofolate reductase [Clostridia bacterium]